MSKLKVINEVYLYRLLDIYQNPISLDRIQYLVFAAQLHGVLLKKALWFNYEFVMFKRTPYSEELTKDIERYIAKGNLANSKKGLSLTDNACQILDIQIALFERSGVDAIFNEILISYKGSTDADVLKRIAKDFPIYESAEGEVILDKKPTEEPPSPRPKTPPKSQTTPTPPKPKSKPAPPSNPSRPSTQKPTERNRAPVEDLDLDLDLSNDDLDTLRDLGSSPVPTGSRERPLSTRPRQVAVSEPDDDLPQRGHDRQRAKSVTTLDDLEDLDDFSSDDFENAFDIVEEPSSGFQKFLESQVPSLAKLLKKSPSKSKTKTKTKKESKKGSKSPQKTEVSSTKSVESTKKGLLSRKHSEEEEDIPTKKGRSRERDLDVDSTKKGSPLSLIFPIAGVVVLGLVGKYMFIDNQMSAFGEGKLYRDTGSVIYEGQFNWFSPSGSGKFYSADGILVYEGASLKGKYHGSGKLYNEFGQVVYEGEFKEGKPDGQGKRYLPDGLIQEGLFQGGEFVGIGQDNQQLPQSPTPDPNQQPIQPPTDSNQPPTQ